MFAVLVFRKSYSNRERSRGVVLRVMLWATLIAGLALVAEQSGRLSSATTLIAGLTLVAEQSGRLIRERRRRKDEQRGGG